MKQSPSLSPHLAATAPGQGGGTTERLLVALSGGADSVALLLMLLERGQAGAAAHCNFHLRGAESDRDEAFVRRLCEERGVRLLVRHFDTEAEAARTGESIEMAARRLRYTWLAEACRAEGLDGVAVAHHREDNAETVLLNLIRGTGLKGLTGMQAERREAGVRIVRPLLHRSRAELLDYLARAGQDYVTDSTNADTHYRRNRIRHEVLPLLQQINPQIIDTLNATARRLAGSEQLADFAAEELRAAIVHHLPEERGLDIDTEALAQAPAPQTLLHTWLAPYGFRAAQTAEAAALRTGGLLETAEWLLTRTTHTLELRRRPVFLSPIPLSNGYSLLTLADGRQLEVRWLSRYELKAIPRDRHCAVLDADRLSAPLQLRSVAEGDRFAPFGMRGTRLVSDYLTDRHRSRIDKLGALVVTHGQEIAWLVGERIAEPLRITEATRRILYLQYFP